jgi:4-amino-4-deoxy-L-arabinose transferase-like glycosyltransferase
VLSLPRTLGLLLLLSSLQQVQFIARAPLAAQDAVEFVSVAQRIEADGLAATIRRERVAPLFPTIVYATHSVLTAAGVLDPTAWGRAAQIAAAVPLVFALIPVFLLARKLAGPDAALVASLLFCLLPATSRLGADGISDSLHLSLAAWALWCLVEACEATSRNVFAWGLAAGGFVGAALLCRAEVLLLAPLIMLVASIRVPRPRTTRAFVAYVSLLACFACGCLTCLVPLVAAGVTESVEIYDRVRGGAPASTVRPLNENPSDRDPARADELQSFADPIVKGGVVLEFGRKDRSRSSRVLDVDAACLLFAHEFLQACGYITLPLALVGAWSLDRKRAVGPWLLLAFVVATFLVTLFCAVLILGYVTSRHFLLPVMALLPAAGLGLVVVARWIQRRFALPDAGPIVRRLGAVVGIGCLLTTLLPPHHTHAAHRSAADWLRSEADATALVLDQHGWTALSSGRPTYRFDEAEAALTDPRLRYVVVERIDLEAASPRGKSLRAVLGSAAQAHVLFADVRGRSAHDVLLFSRTPDDAYALRSTAPPVVSSLTARRNPSHAR